MRTNTKLMVPAPMTVQLEQSTVAEPGPNQVLIRNDYTVMNLGTEMAIFAGKFPPGSWWDQHVRYPHWEGWGCLGEVVALGEGVTNFQVGDRVVGDGAHGSYYLASLDRPDAPQLIPEGITDEQAGLWSLSRVSLHGIRVARIDVGEAVVVLGQGIVGQLALRFARLSGAFPLIAVDLSAGRLEMASRGGATHVCQGSIETLLDEIVQINKGRKVDCVLEVTGNPDTISHALKLPRMRGRLIILGSPRGISQVDFHDQIHFGVDVLGAQWSTYPRVESPLAPWTTARNGELYLDLVRAGLLNVDGLISHTFDWREAPVVYHQIYEDRTRFMAVRFDWRDSPD
jgi:2-desacetyl-2-hydroxyethyl bacteriochlorophyllide A dehydrogenase